MAGRPTKYRHKYIKMMNKYFGNEPYYEENCSRIANVFPTMDGFASLINVDCDTLVEWSKPKNEPKYPGFSATYKRAKDCQINMLIQNGLQGLYSAKFAIFIAKNLITSRERMYHKISEEPLTITCVTSQQ